MSIPTTSNLGLKKPTLSDGANIGDLNDNSDILDGIFNLIYPVGSIYMSTSDADPSTLFGGTWSQIKGKFLYACEDSGIIAGATGGAKNVSYTPAGAVENHTLTTSEIPTHAHGLNSHTHSVGAHNHGLNNHTHTIGAHNHSFTGSAVNTGTQSANHSHSVTAKGSVSSNFTGSAGNTGWGNATMRIVHADGNAGYANHVTGHSGDTGDWHDSGTWPGQAHSHSFTPSGTVNSTFTGIAVNSGANNANHTHSVTAAGTVGNSAAYASGAASGNTANSEAFNTGVASGDTANAGGGGAHNHDFTGTAATIATMPPYLAVYVWKRTA